MKKAMRKGTFTKVMALLLAAFMTVSVAAPSQVFAEDEQPSVSIVMEEKEHQVNEEVTEVTEKAEESSNIEGESKEVQDIAPVEESSEQAEEKQNEAEEKEPAVSEEKELNKETASVDSTEEKTDEAPREQKDAKEQPKAKKATKAASEKEEPVQPTEEKSEQSEPETLVFVYQPEASSGLKLAANPKPDVSDGTTYEGYYRVVGNEGNNLLDDDFDIVLTSGGLDGFSGHFKCIQPGIAGSKLGTTGSYTAVAEVTISGGIKTITWTITCWGSSFYNDYSGYNEKYQNMQLKGYQYTIELEGDVVVEKSSSASAAYIKAHALTGAEYTIYTDAKATKKLKGADVLKIKSSGKSQKVSVPAGTYYVKETKTPKGYDLDTKIHKVTVKAGKTATVESTEKPDKKKFTIKKTAKNGEFYSQVKDMSAYKDMTATFEVKITDLAGDTTTATVKTNADGEWTSKKSYEAGTKFEITEVVAPKNYLLPTTEADKTKKLTLSLTEDKNTVTFADDCVGDPVRLRIAKVDPKKAPIETDKFAEFDVWFYDNANAEGTPLRHWVYRTNNGKIEFWKDAPHSGDAPYKNDEQLIVFPVGSLRVKEKTAPEGYAAATQEWIAVIEQETPGEAPVMRWVSQSESGVFEYTDPDNVNIVNQHVRGGVKVLKVNADTNEVDPALAGTVIRIYAAEEIQDKDNDLTYYERDLVKSIVVGEDGIAKTGERDLPAGKYYAKEFSTVNGVQLNTAWHEEFEIKAVSEANGVLVDLTNAPVANKPMKMRTMASDVKTGSHTGVADASAQVSDIVYYENLNDGESYYLEAALVDAATGETVSGPKFRTIAIDESGTMSGESGVGLWYGKSSGTVTMPAFDIDASEMGGKTVVVVEKMYKLPEMTLVLSHDSLNDENQSVHYIDVHTTAKDSKTGTHGGTAAEDAAIVDTVEMNNLVVGETYTVSGKLMNEDGSVFEDADGNEVTAKKKFEATAANMSVNLKFEFDAYEMGGKAVVVFEKLFQGEVEVAKHEDKDDKGQTVRYPGVHTTAADSETGTHTGVVGRNVKVVDEVKLNGLTVGNEYTVKGILMNKDGSEFRDAEGHTKEHTKVFTATEEEMTIEFVFELDSTDMAGKSVVVFETLYEGSTVVARHEDKDDEGQTVNYPEIHTNAADGKTEDHAGIVEEEATIVDTVSYKNLIVGKEYTIKGVLKNTETGESITDENGNDITAEVQFTPTEKDGEVDLTFVLDSRLLAGESVVAFEHLYHNDVHVAAHADIEDEDQTVNYPDVHTTASDKDTGSHMGTRAEEAVIKDIVELENLMPSETYKVSGRLMTSEGEPFLDAEGNEYTAEKEFTADSHYMTIELEFPLNSWDIDGKTLVVFEKLFHSDVEVARHEDKDDEGQSVHYPSVKTTATDANTGTHAGINGVTKIIDKVEMENLIDGVTYTVKGRLMTSEGTAYPDEENAITAECTFEATGANETITLEFPVDATGFEGKSLVVFEKLFLGEVEIARHEDVEDEGQTIHFPEVHTTLTDSETLDHVALADETIKLVDTVEYKNLASGEYVVKGVLMDKQTGKTIKDDKGKEITAEAAFTLEPGAEPNGTVDVVFEFKGVSLAGKSAVAFETLYSGDIELATHADIEDEDQTVVFPEVKTSVRDAADKDRKVKEGETVTIIDTVSYKNLIPGKEYVVKGVLMDKSTGKECTKNGKAITGETKFIPKEKDGTVEVEFKFDTTGLKEKELVVFEKLYIVQPSAEGGLVEVGRHEDINDKDQTIKVIPDNVKTGDTTKVAPYALMFIGAGMLLMIAMIAMVKKNRKQIAGK